MTYLPSYETSSIKSDLLNSKAGAEISGVIIAHFDRTDIVNTNIVSTNDYQFTLSSTSGSSFILEGGILIQSADGNTATATIRWYDETNSRFIGTKGFVSAKINSTNVDPYYSSTATALILSSDFNGSDITVSLRTVSTTGNANYPAYLTSSNNRVFNGILKIMQT